MKILQITPNYYPSIGGLQEHVRNISERMAGENQVTVFTGDSSGKLDGEEEINGVLVKRFHSFSPNNAYHLSLDMLKELRRSEFDVVHGHSYHALPLYFSRYARRKKFIITPHYHGHGHTPFRDVLFKLYKPFGKRIFADADIIISVSNYERKLLVHDFSPEESKIRLIPNGINSAELHREKMSGKTRNILYVGRLEKYKGVQHIIQALPLIDEDISLEIVGMGGYERQLISLVDKLGINQRVKFYQFLPHSNLIEMYARAGVVVLLSQYEAYSIVVAEALATKTPCIVADTSALKEWIDNKSCFGIDYPASSNKLAELVNEVTGKKVAGGKSWDWDEVTQALIQIYMED